MSAKFMCVSPAEVVDSDRALVYATALQSHCKVKSLPLLFLVLEPRKNDGQGDVP